MKYTLLLFFRVFIKRAEQNQLPVTAGYLTYNTMLAMVPLIMVVFSVFTIFPFFTEATEQLKSFIYDNFAPNIGDVVQQNLDSFVNNSKQMGIVSTIGLVVVALMLIHNVDKALNGLWHEPRKRSIFISFLLYAVILVLAPLVAGVSIAITSYIMSLSLFNEVATFSLTTTLLNYTPFLLIWLLFTLIYKFVPNTPVKFKHACVGALFAGIFFTLGKQAFIWYITIFPSYQAIYGALAVLPIMLLWIHLSWQVVLLGGQFAAVLKELEMIKQEKKDKNDSINSTC